MPATQATSERPAATPALDDDYDFYSTQDLIDRKIVSDRKDLGDKIKNHGFPPGIKMGLALQARRIFGKRKVHAWVDSKDAEQPNEAA